VAAAVGLLVVGGAAPSRGEGPALRWAADSEGGAPYVFKDPQHPSQYLGFEVDLAAALGRELGRPLQFEQYEFENLISGLERGDFDLAMNGLEITPERARRVRFSRPYYIYQLQLVARVGEGRFHSLDDCRGRADLTIGTLGGSAGERALDRRGIRKALYTDQLGPYRDLHLGRIDGVLLDLPIALYFAKSDFVQPYVEPIPGLEFVGEPLDPGYYAIAVGRDEVALADALDAALERLLHNGELARIYTKWGLWNKDQDRLFVASAADVTEEPANRWTFRHYFPLLGSGAVVTVFLTLAGMALAVLLGMPVALTRLYGPAPLRWAAVVYVEFFRGIPVLLLLYFLYYGLPGIAEQFHLPVTLRLNALTAAVLGFGLNYAAYEAEIYRAGIGSIPLGQWEAARSLGMSDVLTFRRIILPQTLRVILPPMTNDLVALFKDTSVVSIIAVVELSKEYQILTRSGGGYLEIGLTTAALYLIMSVPLGYLSRYLERRWGRGV
jgi:polar amino acid transport system substrate-binding protein